MFLQRAPLPASAGAPPVDEAERPPAADEPFWRPSGMRRRPRVGDVYLVIDDLVADENARIAVLAVAPWPRLDSLGRFVFRESDRSKERLAVDPDLLQERVNAARARAKVDEEIQKRPMRNGATFV